MCISRGCSSVVEVARGWQQMLEFDCLKNFGQFGGLFQFFGKSLFLQTWFLRKPNIPERYSEVDFWDLRKIFITKYLQCHSVVLRVFVRHFATEIMKFMRHLKYFCFQNAAKMRGSSGGTIWTIITAVRARKSKKFFSQYTYIGVNPGNFWIHLFEFAENGIRVKSHPIVSQKFPEVPSPFYFIFILLKKSSKGIIKQAQMVLSRSKLIPEKFRASGHQSKAYYL